MSKENGYGDILRQAKYYIAVLRLDHWHKNLFTLLGSLGAIAYFHIPFSKIEWQGIILGLFLSCLMSSVNYVINEFLDASFDALHPTKRYRSICRVYTAESLMHSMHMYALLTLAIFTWVSTRYKPAFLYFLPFAIAFFVWFYILTIQKDSFASNPEKAYLNKPLLAFCVTNLAFLIFLGIYG